ncbi:MAG: Riboflavin synthase [Chlamydiales bacterium]|nr:Riboflavin synthase [Chlamydiales bacterium]MCH9619253.1 Riboflavin synthase [Chlamydiales bacterium]MCH9622515.1 Riboflavin synthase [Chlamydiales bacterium]
MFSGIIQQIGTIIDCSQKHLLVDFTYETLLFGSSVSIDGVCLTAVRFEDKGVHFDLTEETVRCTTLGELKKGDRVNIERSLKYGDEIGGHLVSGHVLQTVKLIEIKKNVYTFSTPSKELLHKGFVSLNGASLTVCQPDNKKFEVHFIPETLARTTFSEKRVGDSINLE